MSRSACSIWDRVTDCSRKALAHGSLSPLETRLEHLRDGGLDYVIRTLVNMAKKPRGSKRTESDPFRPPWEPGLHVADLDVSHSVLLNKYNVLPGHVLVVTRRFEDQTDLLDETDFAAWLEVLAGNRALGFHNGGIEAGASQPHRHMQAVPITSREQIFPFAPVFDSAAGDEPGRITRLTALPFAHVAVRMDACWREAPRRAAARFHGHYLEMWSALGLDPAGKVQPVPYNLLIAGDWMWLIPRRCESYEGISINGLGFAGALLVPGEAARDRLRSAGPGRALESVAGIP